LTIVTMACQGLCVMALVLDEVLADARRRQALPSPPVRRYVRERAGLTQDEVALLLNVTRPAVTRWEGGGRSPRGDLRLRYVELLERLAQEARGIDDLSPTHEKEVI
jgi:DNA-binding transcriptional regulator YiaG